MVVHHVYVFISESTCKSVSLHVNDKHYSFYSIYLFSYEMFYMVVIDKNCLSFTLSLVKNTPSF